jgi:hypothetical protein
VRVIWRERPVGDLREVQLDMWYLEGRFEPLAGAEAFVALAGSLDPGEVQRDPAAGTRVLLEGDDGQTHALVLGLEAGRLSVRRVIRDEAVAWLLAHVR